MSGPARRSRRRTCWSNSRTEAPGNCQRPHAPQGVGPLPGLRHQRLRAGARLPRSLRPRPETSRHAQPGRRPLPPHAEAALGSSLRLGPTLVAAGKRREVRRPGREAGASRPGRSGLPIRRARGGVAGDGGPAAKAGRGLPPADAVELFLPGRNFPLRPPAALYKSPLTQGRGRSSGVEHYLAKVRVVSSNLIARSKNSRWISEVGNGTASAVLFRLSLPLDARRLPQAIPGLAGGTFTLFSCEPEFADPHGPDGPAATGRGRPRRGR